VLRHVGGMTVLRHVGGMNVLRHAGGTALRRCCVETTLVLFRSALPL
jgi:hypothetical protein